jgi:molecular chaperone HscB
MRSETAAAAARLRRKCHDRGFVWLAANCASHFCFDSRLIQAGIMTAPAKTGAAAADYFSVFGLPRKLWVEMSALEQKFLQLSWKLHPDNFVNATEEEQELSLKRSSELNDAYRTLRDPVTRVEYLLEMEGERKEGERKQQAPPELLEEVFELNESLDELREAKSAGMELDGLKARLQAAEKNFGQKLAEVDAQMQATAKNWDAAVDAGADDSTRKKIMARLNEHLNRRSYIRNLVVSVAKELAEA